MAGEKQLRQGPPPAQVAPSRLSESVTGYDSNLEAALLGAQSAGATAPNRVAVLSDIGTPTQIQKGILANSNFAAGLTGWVQNTPHPIDSYPESLFSLVQVRLVPCSLDCACGRPLRIEVSSGWTGCYFTVLSQRQDFSCGTFARASENITFNLKGRVSSNGLQSEGIRPFVRMQLFNEGQLIGVQEEILSEWLQSADPSVTEDFDIQTEVQVSCCADEINFTLGWEVRYDGYPDHLFDPGSRVGVLQSDVVVLLDQFQATTLVCEDPDCCDPCIASPSAPAIRSISDDGILEFCGADSNAQETCITRVQGGRVNVYDGRGFSTEGDCEIVQSATSADPRLEDLRMPSISRQTDVTSDLVAQIQAGLSPSFDGPFIYRIDLKQPTSFESISGADSVQFEFEYSVASTSNPGGNLDLILTNALGQNYLVPTSVSLADTGGPPSFSPASVQTSLTLELGNILPLSRNDCGELGSNIIGEAVDPNDFDWNQVTSIGFVFPGDLLTDPADSVELKNLQISILDSTSATIGQCEVGFNTGGSGGGAWTEQDYLDRTRTYRAYRESDPPNFLSYEPYVGNFDLGLSIEECGNRKALTGRWNTVAYGATQTDDLLNIGLRFLKPQDWVGSSPWSRTLKMRLDCETTGLTQIMGSVEDQHGNLYHFGPSPINTWSETLTGPATILESPHDGRARDFDWANIIGCNFTLLANEPSGTVVKVEISRFAFFVDNEELYSESFNKFEPSTFGERVFRSTPPTGTALWRHFDNDAEQAMLWSLPHPTPATGWVYPFTGPPADFTTISQVAVEYEIAYQNHDLTGIYNPETSDSTFPLANPTSPALNPQFTFTGDPEKRGRDVAHDTWMLAILQDEDGRKAIIDLESLRLQEDSDGNSGLDGRWFHHWMLDKSAVDGSTPEERRDIVPFGTWYSTNSPLDITRIVAAGVIWRPTSKEAVVVREVDFEDNTGTSISTVDFTGIGDQASLEAAIVDISQPGTALTPSLTANYFGGFPVNPSVQINAADFDDGFAALWFPLTLEVTDNTTSGPTWAVEPSPFPLLRFRYKAQASTGAGSIFARATFQSGRTLWFSDAQEDFDDSAVTQVTLRAVSRGIQDVFEGSSPATGPGTNVLTGVTIFIEANNSASNIIDVAEVEIDVTGGGMAYDRVFPLSNTVPSTSTGSSQAHLEASVFVEGTPNFAELTNRGEAAQGALEAKTGYHGTFLLKKTFDSTDLSEVIATQLRLLIEENHEVTKVESTAVVGLGLEDSSGNKVWLLEQARVLQPADADDTTPIETVRETGWHNQNWWTLNLTNTLASPDGFFGCDTKPPTGAPPAIIDLTDIVALRMLVSTHQNNQYVSMAVEAEQWKKGDFSGFPASLPFSDAALLVRYVDFLLPEYEGEFEELHGDPVAKSQYLLTDSVSLPDASAYLEVILDGRIDMCDVPIAYLGSFDLRYYGEGTTADPDAWEDGQVVIVPDKGNNQNIDQDDARYGYVKINGAEAIPPEGCNNVILLYYHRRTSDCYGVPAVEREYVFPSLPCDCGNRTGGAQGIGDFIVQPEMKRILPDHGGHALAMLPTDYSGHTFEFEFFNPTGSGLPFDDNTWVSFTSEDEQQPGRPRVIWIGGGDGTFASGVPLAMQPTDNVYTRVYYGPAAGSNPPAHHRETALAADVNIPGGSLTATLTISPGSFPGAAVGMPIWLRNACNGNGHPLSVCDHTEGATPDVTGLYGEITDFPSANQVEITFYDPTPSEADFLVSRFAQILISPRDAQGYYIEVSSGISNVFLSPSSPVNICELPRVIYRYNFDFWDGSSICGNDCNPCNTGSTLICDGDGINTEYEIVEQQEKRIINPREWKNLQSRPEPWDYLDAGVVPGDTQIQVCDPAQYPVGTLIRIADDNTPSGTLHEVTEIDEVVGTVDFLPPIPNTVPGYLAFFGYTTLDNGFVVKACDIFPVAWSADAASNVEGVPQEPRTFVVDQQRGILRFNVSNSVAAATNTYLWQIGGTMRICATILNNKIDISGLPKGTYKLQQLTECGDYTCDCCFFEVTKPDEDFALQKASQPTTFPAGTLTQPNVAGAMHGAQPNVRTNKNPAFGDETWNVFSGLLPQAGPVSDQR